MEVTSFTERGKVNSTQKSIEIMRLEGCLQTPGGFASTLMNWKITSSITKTINHCLLRVDILHMNKRASTSTTQILDTVLWCLVYMYSRD